MPIQKLERTPLANLPAIIRAHADITLRLMNPIHRGVGVSFVALCRAIVHRGMRAGVLCMAALGASVGAAQATGFTLEQILSAPFPSGLVAAPAKAGTLKCSEQRG
ncbi:MAG: hypothetical protein WA642_07040 [Steroidobacteraceae bacterium]